MICPVAEQRDESMKKQISITACRHAILITERGYEPGIPLDIDGEERIITDVEIRGGSWYAKDQRLTRGQQETLTKRAYTIIENDRQPRAAPAKSIRDCQKAIGIAGGIRISLRGKERLITEVRTGGGREYALVQWRSSVYYQRAETSDRCGEKPSSNTAASQRGNYRCRTWTSRMNRGSN